MTDKVYIERSQLVIHRLQRCATTWLESNPVHEVFRGQTFLKGFVEVFALGHPNTKKAWALNQPPGKDDKGEECVAVLELPAVESLITALRAKIVAEAEGKKRQECIWIFGSIMELFSCLGALYFRALQPCFFQQYPSVSGMSSDGFSRRICSWPFLRQ